MDIPGKVFFITEHFLKACLKGLVVTGSKNVKILKYRNVTKILHGLEDLLDEIQKPRLEKSRDLDFCMEMFRNNCTFNVH
jgi:hypothetical protein